MAGSVNKVIDLYALGQSIPDVAAAIGMSRSTVRYHLKKAGALRSRADGIRLAREKLGKHLIGKSRTFTAAHRAAMQASAIIRGQRVGIGVSEKASGYIVMTRGPDKDRGVHVVIMEKRLGRRLLPDEVVHHIDGDRSNNDENNLGLMTRAGHARLHRRERKISKGNN